MIARLTTRCGEHVQEIQQRRSAQFAGKKIKQDILAGLKSKTPSQDVRKKEREHKESDNIQQMAIPDPVVSQVVSQDPVVMHDRFGNPLSARGLPLTLWSPTSTCYRELIESSHASTPNRLWRLPWRRRQ
jgi:hypothetical protein